MHFFTEDNLFEVEAEILFDGSNPTSFRSYFENPKFYSNYVVLTLSNAAPLVVGVNITVHKPDPDLPLVYNEDYLMGVVAERIADHIHKTGDYKLVKGKYYRFPESPDVENPKQIEENLEILRKLVSGEKMRDYHDVPLFLGNGCLVSYNILEQVTKFEVPFPDVFVKSIGKHPDIEKAFMDKYVEHCATYLKTKDFVFE